MRCASSVELSEQLRSHSTRSETIPAIAVAGRILRVVLEGYDSPAIRRLLRGSCGCANRQNHRSQSGGKAQTLPGLKTRLKLLPAEQTHSSSPEKPTTRLWNAFDLVATTSAPTLTTLQFLCAKVCWRDNWDSVDYQFPLEVSIFHLG